MLSNLLKVRSPFGRFIDKLNRKHNITQTNFAKLANVNTNTISKCANGSTRPSKQNAKKIIKACQKFDPNIKIDDFWNYID